MDVSTRHSVWQRAGSRCEYCRLRQIHAAFARFQIEHIRARQHGGGDELANLALACQRCNRSKGPNLSAIDSVTNSIVSIFNPRSEQWNDHFALIGVEIVGLTPTGRATAELLKMNSDDRLALRSALRDRQELDVE